MARKVRTEQDKKKRTKKIIIISLVVIVLVALIGFAVWKFVFNKTENRTAQPIKILDNQKEYGYSLSEKDSEYFKKEYEKLKEILKSDKIDEKE